MTWDRLIPAAVLAALLGAHCASAADSTHLLTHERYVEEVLDQAALPLGDPQAIFGYVLNSLPDRVQVFPTENYYYFSFIGRGVGYSGNIRLDANDRDQGKLHFAYFEDFGAWRDRPAITHLVLDLADGVAVEKLGLLLYRVSYRGKTVAFQLNDLSAVTPPASALGPDEIYLGPIFDDSAIRFFLLFNQRLKVFLYVLDETVPVADNLVPAKRTDRILIGKRTGFAFYRDQLRDRKILIGVFADNARDNNHLDGPFDQLPDNFLRGDSLRQSIIAADPGAAGKIDRFGNFLDRSGRYVIAPYLHYRKESDLAVFDRCVNRKHIEYYECFAVGRLAGKWTAH